MGKKRGEKQKKWEKREKYSENLGIHENGEIVMKKKNREKKTSYKFQVRGKNAIIGQIWKQGLVIFIYRFGNLRTVAAGFSVFNFCPFESIYYRFNFVRKDPLEPTCSRHCTEQTSVTSNLSGLKLPALQQRDVVTVNI